MDAVGIKQAIGLVFKQLPDKLTLHDGETMEVAVSRLKESMEVMCRENPLFWKLDLVARVKELLDENTTSCIERLVEREMAVDPTWMIHDSTLAANKSLQAVVDDLIADHPSAFLRVQRQIADKTTSEVRTLTSHLHKNATSASDVKNFFHDSAKGLLAEATSRPKRRATQNDTEVLDLDKFVCDEWGDTEACAINGEGGPSMSTILTRLAHTTSTTTRVDALKLLHQTPIEYIIHAELFHTICTALIPPMFHPDTSQSALNLYWKLFHATEDITTQCTLYIELITTLFSLPHSLTSLRKQSVLANPVGQKAVLSFFRMLHELIQFLPREWIYAPNDLRSKVMLLTCQLFGEFGELFDTSEGNIAPHCILAWLDPTAQWFALWHRKSPLKEQWLHLVVDSGLLAQLVMRFVWSYESMESWRKLDNEQKAPAVLTHRRSGRAHAHPQPQNNQTYSGFMQRSFMQTAFMLLDLLPQARIQTAFPVVVKVPSKAPKHSGIVLNHELIADESSNNLIYQFVQETRHMTSDQNLNIAYDHFCLHLVLMCVLEGWIGDLWEKPMVPIIPPQEPHTWLHKVEDLFLALKTETIYISLLEVVQELLDLLKEPPPTRPPQSTLSFRFPYSNLSTNLFDSKSLLVLFASQIAVRGEDPSQLSMHLTKFVLPLVVRVMAKAVRPTKTICTNIVQLMNGQWVSFELVSEVAKMSLSIQWFYLLNLSGIVPLLRTYLMNNPQNPDELVTILSQLCATSHGLLHFHDQLSNISLESLWANVFPRRPMSILCHLANVPQVCTAWLRSPTLQAAWRQAVEDLNSDIEGLDAVYGPSASCPYKLRPSLNELLALRRIYCTQYASTSHLDPHQIAPSSSDVNYQVVAMLNFQLSSTLRGAQQVQDIMGDRFPPCSCKASPCILDPPTWMYHMIRQCLASVGGSSEVCSISPMEIATNVIPLLQYPSEENLRMLHRHVQRVLVCIEESTNYLDFPRVAESFWETIACFDTQFQFSTPEATSWFGDIIWHVIVSGKSRLDLSQMNDTFDDDIPINQPVPDEALQWANHWTKIYATGIQNISDPPACSTRFPFLFQALGMEANDPFVWSCLMLLTHRRNDMEVLHFLRLVRRSSSSLYFWPERACTKFPKANVPMFRIAAAVEYILAAEFPHITVSLERQGCSVLSLLLRWHSQCFWNYLNWPEIMIYINLVCIHGVESEVYLLVVLLHHIQDQIRELEYEDLLRLRIPNFHWSSFRSLFAHLHKTYDVVVHEFVEV
ncbi:hypothetical protein AeMF1_018469 [Aphanomyces euteiches]|nr:hypothetical protein AeMF1_018469 [Aphanomyces euteiches]KAH9197504.1 hypothetical protein AeNC1_000510 [Aphanomyces euteiches]